MDCRLSLTLLVSSDTAHRLFCIVKLSTSGPSFLLPLVRGGCLSEIFFRFGPRISRLVSQSSIFSCFLRSSDPVLRSFWPFFIPPQNLCFQTFLLSRLKNCWPFQRFPPSSPIWFHSHFPQRKNVHLFIRTLSETHVAFPRPLLAPPLSYNPGGFLSGGGFVPAPPLPAPHTKHSPFSFRAPFTPPFSVHSP